ncbi:hypothetical protein [Planococcus shixiaomingii]|nr:hypothetical protein [Planococcus sp. N022]WKA54645.1 hypothetical protein QWY21_18575 [Planococcus sp. N022]
MEERNPSKWTAGVVKTKETSTEKRIKEKGMIKIKLNFFAKISRKIKFRQ